MIDTSRKSATLALMSKAVQLDSYGGVDVLEVPIAGVCALNDVRDAFREVALRHTRGKLVLRP
jgi:hypothetical protein